MQSLYTIELTQNQKSLLLHTLGLNKNPPHDRNWIGLGDGSKDDNDCKLMVEIGILKQVPTPAFCERENVYVATEYGKELAKEFCSET